MKGLKKGAILLCAAGLGALCLSGCSSRFSQENIVAAVSDSVSFPEQYSIAYEVETAEGMIYTVKNPGMLPETFILSQRIKSCCFWQRREIIFFTRKMATVNLSVRIRICPIMPAIWIR